jgi:hypothetical protein
MATVITVLNSPAVKIVPREALSLGIEDDVYLRVLTLEV